MTTIHVQEVGEQALIPRAELERLLQLARRVEAIEVESAADDITTQDLMHLAQVGGSFDFWHEDGEDIYTLNDGEPV